jgi:hypothetical protein
MCIFILRLARLLLAGESIYLALSGKGVTSLQHCPAASFFHSTAHAQLLAAAFILFHLRPILMTGKKTKKFTHLYTNTHSLLWMKPFVCFFAGVSIVVDEKMLSIIAFGWAGVGGRYEF